MELKEFKSYFQKLSPIDLSAKKLVGPKVRLQWKGLIGSSRALCASALAEQVPGNHLFILNDKEEAAYFLNDLESLYPDDKRVLFYPASYRVPYQLEETDNANVVSRAEVLEKMRGWLRIRKLFLKKFLRKNA
jgi:transcription-repair coupling factor (superfamily II helicase)